MGRYKEAQKLYLEVLREREEVLGGHHKDTLQTKQNYAVTLEHLKLCKEAEKLYL